MQILEIFYEILFADIFFPIVILWNISCAIFHEIKCKFVEIIWIIFWKFCNLLIINFVVY